MFEVGLLGCVICLIVCCFGFLVAYLCCVCVLFACDCVYL